MRYTPVHRVRVGGRSLPHATARTRETRLRTVEHSIPEDSIDNSPYGTATQEIQLGSYTEARGKLKTHLSARAHLGLEPDM